MMKNGFPAVGFFFSAELELRLIFMVRSLESRLSSLEKRFAELEGEKKKEATPSTLFDESLRDIGRATLLFTTGLDLKTHPESSDTDWFLRAWNVKGEITPECRIKFAEMLLKMSHSTIKKATEKLEKIKSK